jgi:hypothetical protein
MENCNYDTYRYSAWRAHITHHVGLKFNKRERNVKDSSLEEEMPSSDS